MGHTNTETGSTTAATEPTSTTSTTTTTTTSPSTSTSTSTSTTTGSTGTETGSTGTETGPTSTPTTSTGTATHGTRRIVYWSATVLVTAELVTGGMWDALRTSEVREVIEHLGYPSYFLVVLGVWKLLGALALLAPRLPLLKEWAYAGVVFVDTGAIASHLSAGYGRAELGFLIPLLVLTVLSWALRPPSRRVPRA